GGLSRRRARLRLQQATSGGQDAMTTQTLITQEMFERQQLQAAVAALEVTGLVMVPAMMAGTVATIFQAANPLFDVEYGVWGDEEHSPSKVYGLLQCRDAMSLCWVRSPKVIEKQMVEVEGVEIENGQHFREMLAKYRREGLGWADELALYAAVFYCPDDT